MARYSGAQSALVPHQYMHDLVVPASYIVVKPKKGHSTTFRVAENVSVAAAILSTRSRGFEPLYVINAKQPKHKPLLLASPSAHINSIMGEGK